MDWFWSARRILVISIYIFSKSLEEVRHLCFADVGGPLGWLLVCLFAECQSRGREPGTYHVWKQA